MRRVVAALVIAAGCAPSAGAPATWHGLPVRGIEIAGAPMTVAVASTNAEQSRGLSGVTELDGIDGMLFVFSTPTDVRFWMKDTLISLDVAFFDSDGVLIDVMTMPVCDENPCPKYGPARSFDWAVEAPAGGPLASLPAGSVIVS